MRSLIVPDLRALIGAIVTGGTAILGVALADPDGDRIPFTVLLVLSLALIGLLLGAKAALWAYLVGALVIVASSVVPPQQMADAREVRRLMGALRDVKELIEIGAYQSGTDPLVDRARQLAPQIESFLQQPMGDSTPPAESWGWLQRIVRGA